MQITAVKVIIKVQEFKPKATTCWFRANLPADAGNKWLGPDGRDDKERLRCRFGFYILITRHQVVPVSVVLLVQGINLVGCLDYFSGHKAWLTGAKTIHAICMAAV